MTLIEILVTTIGFAVGKGLLSVWLKDNPVPDAVGSELLDLIKSKTTDIFAAREGKRFFEKIGDKVAQRLHPLFASYEKQLEGQGITRVSVEAVAQEVATAIEVISKCINSCKTLKQ
jgi:hypothetical protein